ncbi:MAG: hypothetical protein E7315_06320 [Clostridiales bacterium]|nr:hypothetical protein [Clostridiales bacterium]
MKTAKLHKIIGLILSIVFILSLCGCVSPTDKPDATPSSTPKTYDDFIEITVGLPDRYVDENGNLKTDGIINPYIYLADFSFNEILQKRFGLKIKGFTWWGNVGKYDMVFGLGRFSSGDAATTDESVIEANSRMERLINENNVVDISQYYHMMPYYKEYIDKTGSTALFNSTKVHSIYRSDLMSAQLLADSLNKQYKIDLLPGYNGMYWMYNEEWFTKYNYDIPQTLDELIALLLRHKAEYPQSKPIGDSSEYAAIEKGIGASYGIRLNYDGIFSSNDNKDNVLWREDAKNLFYLDGEKVSFALNTDAYIKALDMLKSITEGSLTASDDSYVLDHYKLEQMDCAVVFTYPELLVDNSGETSWRLFDNGLPAEGYKAIAYSETGLRYNSSSIMLCSRQGDECVERMISYIDWCMSNEGIMYAYFGVEGEDYTVLENGKIKMLKYVDDNITPDLNPIKDGIFVSSALKLMGSQLNNLCINGDVSDALGMLNGVNEKTRAYMANILNKQGRNLEGVNYNISTLPVITQVERIIPKTTVIDEKEYSVNGGIVYTDNEEMRISYCNLKKIVTDFLKGYMLGTKTTTDLEEYKNDIANAGLDNIIELLQNEYSKMSQWGSKPAEAIVG